MAYLQYDTDTINNVKTQYVNYVTKMDEIQYNMKKMVDEIREAWRSEAGDAFFDKFDNEWLKGFEQYKEVLNHMSDILAVAGERYLEITRLANKLGLI